MQYVQQHRGVGGNMPSILAVIGIHVLVGYALASGLARKVVDVIKAPIETKIIEELKPPPPEAPPPPPPKLAPPPPPFIPPPEINVQVPQAAVSPSITTVTTTPPPPRTPVVAAPPAPPPAKPAVRRDFAAIHRVNPEYPPKAKRAGVAGIVVAHVQVQPDGTVSEVRIVSAKPPQLFDREVVRALMQWKFNPEPTGFVGEYEIAFQLKD